MNRSAKYLFRLYVAGSSPNSSLALRNLSALCQTHLPERHEIEIIDVLKTPERALQDGIIVTPTLVKLSPPPVGRLIGNLTPPETVLSVLGVALTSP